MNADIAELLHAQNWLRSGHRVALATVIRTWGSAPRPAGSQLAIRDDGVFEGSVSGGCVEGEVLEAALACLTTGSPQLLSFGVSNDRAWEAGLACGGQIDILVQPDVPASLVDSVVAAVQRGDRCAVATDITSGRSLILEKPPAVSAPDSSGFVQVYQPKLRLAVIGAVHISQALLPMAQILGYDCLLIDPRTAFTSAGRFDSIPISHAWPDEALRDWNLTTRTAVVTLTHDPKLDDPALAVALKSDAFYIAALGSKKTHAARCARLSALGFSDSELARIHGPAGLRIGALSPAEIALSVLAEMTAVLHKVPD